MSLVILHLLLVPLHFLYFSGSLDRLLSKKWDKPQNLLTCNPFSGALKQVWGDDVGQRSYLEAAQYALLEGQKQRGKGHTREELQTRLTGTSWVDCSLPHKL